MASLANKILPASVTAESKAARKKKAKVVADGAPSTSDMEPSGSAIGIDADAKVDGVIGGEHAYIKDLQKRIRNVNKKLTAASKLDSLLAEHAQQSLDELVTAKVINNDQKAQALKKPALQAELGTLEEQLARAKEMETQHQDALAKERELLSAKHANDLEGLRKATEIRVKLETDQAFKIKLLTFGRFLKAAAARRSEGEDDQDTEARAFEGVLSNVYTGDVSAVEAIEKLINGVDEKVRDYVGEIDVTYARIKELTLQETPVDDEDPWSTKPEIPVNPQSDSVPVDTETIPTHPGDHAIDNAALTEIRDISTTIPNGIILEAANSGEAKSQTTAPTTVNIGENTGNAAAEEQWDTKPAGELSGGMEDSYEIIPRPADEVDIKDVDAPAAPTSTQSWAEEAQAAATESQATSTNGDDGFHEVTHRGPRQHRGWGPGDRGRGRGRGNFRGRGGERGEFRGRGRGGPRGSHRPRGDEAVSAR